MGSFRHGTATASIIVASDPTDGQDSMSGIAPEAMIAGDAGDAPWSSWERSSSLLGKASTGKARGLPDPVDQPGFHPPMPCTARSEMPCP